MGGRGQPLPQPSSRGRKWREWTPTSTLDSTLTINWTGLTTLMPSSERDRQDHSARGASDFQQAPEDCLTVCSGQRTLLYCGVLVGWHQD